MGEMQPMTAPTSLIALIIGSGRSDRFARYPAAWLTEQLAARADLRFTTVDIREVTLGFYDEAVPPAKLPREFHGNTALEDLSQAIDAADGFLLLTPEYNHGYPAQLKNALDHLFVEFNRKPIAFVGYGNVGAARAIEQLRLVAVELEMVPTRYSVNIFPSAMIAARAHPASAFADLEGKLTIALDDLVWWSNALHEARSALAQPDA
jgi:NAD(P)H-dependent FMN reductase